MYSSEGMMISIGGSALNKMIFFNGGWMSFYDGIDTDGIVNGGSYIAEHGFGGEVYNFRNSNGVNYGYVMTKTGTIDLKRINLGHEVDRDVIEDIICVFVATCPKGGRRIVGWFQNADIYSQYQYYLGDDRPIIIRQEDWNTASEQVGYFALAQNKDVVLLTEDERMSAPEVPSGKGGFGQSNVWYADSDIGIEFREEVYKFISLYNNRKKNTATSEKERCSRSQSELVAKKNVEERAIKRTWEYYESLGYACTSVEKENKGWDLEVSRGRTRLLVEVKGLSQSYIYVMLSRNEYQKMKANQELYRLAVVTNCLDQRRTPPINIFSYIVEKDGWLDQYGNRINIEEIIAARCELE